MRLWVGAVLCCRSVERETVADAAHMYILSEWDSDNNRLLGHFGPFASQVDAMNYAENERRADPRFTGRGIRWFVDPLTPPVRVSHGFGELRLRLLGWHRSADVASQLFFKTIKLDGAVELY